ARRPRRVLYSRRRESLARRHSRRGRRAVRKASAAAAPADRAADADRDGRRDGGPPHRQGAIRQPRRTQDGAQEDVFLLGQGRARPRLRAGPGAGGRRRGGRLVPRRGVSQMSLAVAIAGLSLAVWVYLLLFRGGFWREWPQPAPPPPPRWPEIVAVIPARD